MDQGDPRTLLVQVAKALDALQIPYLVTGGIAVLVWGRPRFTADIDIVVEVSTRKTLETLRKKLHGISRFSYDDSEAVRDPLRGHSFNFIDGSTGLKVDFFISQGDAMSRARFRRRRRRSILGKSVQFIAPEDLILAKLLWCKNGAIAKHREDIISIITISRKTLRLDYLRSWAKKLGIADVLQEILSAKS